MAIPRTDVRGGAAALAVVVIWAASFSFARQAIEHLGPWMFRFYSVSLGLLPLLGGIAGTLAALRRLDRRSRWQILVAVTVNGSLVATMNIVALSWFPASTVLALIYTMPAFTSLIDAAHSRRWTLLGAAAPAAALAGVLLFAGGSATPLGAGGLLVVANALAWAFGTWLAGQPTQRLPARSMVTLQMLLALLTSLPMVGWVVLQPGALAQPSAADLLGIGWAGLLNGSVVFGLWYYAINLLGAVRASWFTLLVPVLGSAVAVLFFAETLATWQRIGIGLVSVGIALHSLSRRRQQVPRGL
ncbi:DMT family transporter [Stenotrophomonas sp. CFBP8980]|uniref:DMT family transporter n=1 Tax=Stenotrophomonas sp. CFBP8980 TaxID=3096523 RepID=UPI002A69C4B2|nr:DMT family transporter [Stenotrophomonas sp. CFBP8980]MDY1034915.1 DMT family transporter [Stenotrophomonas sp. CFBP8980]